VRDLNKESGDTLYLSEEFNVSPDFFRRGGMKSSMNLGKCVMKRG
jgi:hypothetical protein